MIREAEKSGEMVVEVQVCVGYVRRKPCLVFVFRYRYTSVTTARSCRQALVSGMVALDSACGPCSRQAPIYYSSNTATTWIEFVKRCSSTAAHQRSALILAPLKAQTSL